VIAPARRSCDAGSNRGCGRVGTRRSPIAGSPWRDPDAAPATSRTTPARREQRVERALFVGQPGGADRFQPIRQASNRGRGKITPIVGDRLGAAIGTSTGRRRASGCRRKRGRTSPRHAGERRQRCSLFAVELGPLEGPDHQRPSARAALSSSTARESCPSAACGSVPQQVGRRRAAARRATADRSARP